jgi:hypothetical protein
LSFHLLLLPSKEPAILGLYSQKKAFVCVILVLIGFFLLYFSNLLFTRTPSLKDDKFFNASFKVKRYWLPYFIYFFVSCLLAGSIILKGINFGGDFGNQLLALHFYQLGLLEHFNSLITPIFNDLNKDTYSGLVFYPPGAMIPIHILTLFGMSLSQAVSLFCTICFLSGGIGSLAVIYHLTKSYNVILVCSVLFPWYCYTKVGLQLNFIMTSDIISYGILPWGIFATLLYLKRLTFLKDTILKEHIICFLLGLLIGIIYTIKYSQYVYSCALASAISIAIVFFVRKEIKLINRILLIFTLGISFLLPYYLLNSYNQNIWGDVALTSLSPSDLKNSSYTKNLYGNYYQETTKDWFLLASIPAGLGWNMLGSGFYSDLTKFLSSEILPFNQIIENTLNVNGSLFLALIIGWLLTISLIFLVIGTAKQESPSTRTLYLMITIVPLLLLAYVGNKVGYNHLLSYELRFGLPIIVLVEGLLIHILLNTNFNTSYLFRSIVIVTIFIYPFISKINPKQLLTLNNNSPKLLSNIDTKQLNSCLNVNDDLLLIAGIKDIKGKFLFDWKNIALNIDCRSFALNHPENLEEKIKTMNATKPINVAILVHSYYDFNIITNKLENSSNTNFSIISKQIIGDFSYIIINFPGLDT